MRSSLAARILLALDQVLIVLLLMVNISFQPHGVHSRRVEFWWAGKKEKGPNRTTEQELEADKARLEAAPDEDKPRIIAAMKAEKKKAAQEAAAAAEQEAEAEMQEQLKRACRVYPDPDKNPEHQGPFRLSLCLPKRNSINCTWRRSRSEAEEDRAAVRALAPKGAQAMEAAIREIKVPAKKLKSENAETKSQKRRKQQENRDDLHRQLDENEIEWSASALSMKDNAEMTFKLWSTEPIYQDQPADLPPMLQCLAQFETLKYVGGLRPCEGLPLNDKRLDQQSCSFRTVHTKQVLLRDLEKAPKHLIFEPNIFPAEIVPIVIALRGVGVISKTFASLRQLRM